MQKCVMCPIGDFAQNPNHVFIQQQLVTLFVCTGVGVSAT
jgi:hypothetical protein